MTSNDPSNLQISRIVKQIILITLNTMLKIEADATDLKHKSQR